MMHNKDTLIRNEADKTLLMLDDLPELTPHHLFRVRVMETIERQHPVLLHAPVMARQGVKMALMALLAAINIGTGFLIARSVQEKPMVSKHEVIESLSSEYSSPALSYFIDQTAIDYDSE